MSCFTNTFGSLRNARSADAKCPFHRGRATSIRKSLDFPNANRTPRVVVYGGRWRPHLAQLRGQGFLGCSGGKSQKHRKGCVQWGRAQARVFWSNWVRRARRTGRCFLLILLCLLIFQFSLVLLANGLFPLVGQGGCLSNGAGPVCRSERVFKWGRPSATGSEVCTTIFFQKKS